MAILWEKDDTWPPNTSIHKQVTVFSRQMGKTCRMYSPASARAAATSFCQRKQNRLAKNWNGRKGKVSCQFQISITFQPLIKLSIHSNKLTCKISISRYNIKNPWNIFRNPKYFICNFSSLTSNVKIKFECSMALYRICNWKILKFIRIISYTFYQQAKHTCMWYV
jgi:hypothetical protein